MSAGLSFPPSLPPSLPQEMVGSGVCSTASWPLAPTSLVLIPPCGLRILGGQPFLNQLPKAHTVLPHQSPAGSILFLLLPCDEVPPCLSSLPRGSAGLQIAFVFIRQPLDSWAARQKHKSTWMYTHVLTHVPALSSSGYTHCPVELPGSLERKVPKDTNC